MAAHLPLNILVAPLDWGLGHATRCIPIVKTLENRGVTVILAAAGPQKALLQAEFPHLEFLDIPGYGIRFTGSRGSLVRGLIFRIPFILNRIHQEHAWLRSLCRQRKIDSILSDNRYGLYHKDKHCIFITHQLFIQSGMGDFINRVLLRLNNHFIQKFSQCWVPDFQNPFSIAGILSNPPRMPRIPVKYIGNLSRFRLQAAKKSSNPLLLLISGPEPQRTFFENKLLSQLSQYNGPAVVVRGLPDNKEEINLDGKPIEIYNHLASGPLNELLAASEAVICRSGYSTIMDLLRLRKRAILIPTPGQPEQEYLGCYLHEKKWAYRVSEKDFNLEESMKVFQEREFGFPELTDPEFPEQVTDELLNALIRERP